MNDRQEVFTYFMACGPGVKMSLGAVLNEKVRPDYVVVHAAPPHLTQEITNNFTGVSVREGMGLLIPLSPLPSNLKSISA